MKKFFWKDCSGRGYSNTYTLDEALKCLDFLNDEEGEEGESFFEWLESAEQGDEWVDSANKVICIES